MCAKQKNVQGYRCRRPSNINLGIFVCSRLHNQSPRAVGKDNLGEFLERVHFYCTFISFPYFGGVFNN